MGAAPENGILDALNATGVQVVAANGYHGAGRTVRVPQRRRRLDPDAGRYRRLSRSQKLVNAAHARQRGPGERANAQLKSWMILRKIRCCPHSAQQLEVSRMVAVGAEHLPDLLAVESRPELVGIEERV